MDTNLQILPEECISSILSLTSPRDACRMALVSTTFRSAADSDIVWNKFLPSDYHNIIARSDRPTTMNFESKKKLYLHLSDFSLLVDDGDKSFSLNKRSGKKCFMISPRNLDIVWGDTPNYWVWITLPESRFSEVPELRRVCWLEVRSKINTNMLSPSTKYAVYMVYRLTTTTFGFNHHTVEVSIETLGVETRIRNLYLDPREEPVDHQPIVAMRLWPFSQRWLNMFGSQTPVQKGDDRYPKERKDGWLEIELGEYFNEGGHDQDLNISLEEVKRGNWKSGLIIEGIDIRPKG